ncbi:MAG: hypothetical protein ACLFMX_01340 [Halobacteriales archaeon]
MSDDDRFERVDRALDRLREELDEVIEEGREAGGKAATEVREAIDDVEERLARLRDRDED